MSRDVVLIPAWRRPEFLWHCLANLKRAEGAEQLHYIFRFDHGHTAELYDVLKGFPFSYEVTTSPQTAYRIGKQSYNLLMGYRYAATKAKQFVFMVEEDVMVRDDFFKFHYQVQAAQPYLFCSIAVANPNRRMVDTGGEDEFYTSEADYCSLGVCFNKHTLTGLVDPHARQDYFVNPVDYCRRAFPGTPFGDQFAEQDGLIRRIEWWPTKGHTGIAWPWVPRAFHAGLYGKNRGPGPAGSFATRLQYVTTVIYSDQAMRDQAKHPEWYEDSRPINLTSPPWQNLSFRALDPDRNALRV